MEIPPTKIVTSRLPENESNIVAKRENLNASTTSKESSRKYDDLLGAPYRGDKNQNFVKLKNGTIKKFPNQNDMVLDPNVSSIVKKKII